MLHVNLPRWAYAMVISLSFVRLSLSSIDLESIPWPRLNFIKHNSNFGDTGCVRYSGDLEGIQEKWGGQGLCCSLFPGGGERGGICPGCTGNIFPGGTANLEGEVIVKGDSFHHQEDIQPGWVWKLYHLIIYVSEKYKFCYLSLGRIERIIILSDIST